MTDELPRHVPSDQTLTRATVVLFLFVLWSLAITLRLSQFMIFQRTHYLDSAVDQSVYRGTIAPLRGRILDREGIPLAWSTRSFSLHWHVPKDPERAQCLWRELAPRIEGLVPELGEAEILDTLGRELELSTDLNETTIAVLESSVGTIPGIELQSRFVRHHFPAQGLLQVLGQTEVRDGIEVGISGAEKHHDALLRGVSGKYTVMRNRTGKWLPETWRSLRDMRPGYDVYLPIRVQERGAAAR